MLLSGDQLLFGNQEAHIIYKMDKDGDIFIDWFEVQNKGAGSGFQLMSSFIAKHHDSLIELEAYVVENATRTIDELVAYYGRFGFVEVSRTPADDDEGERVLMHRAKDTHLVMGYREVTYMERCHFHINADSPDDALSKAKSNPEYHCPASVPFTSDRKMKFIGRNNWKVL